MSTTVKDIQDRLEAEGSWERPARRSLAPTRKMLAVGIVGALTTILVGLANSHGIPLDPATAGGIVLSVAALAGYTVPEQS